ncbi:hypothetical protein AZL_018930 [Azospirillum sp. B510]|uniref:hypothetical protein n=1 Tax=Azospirillum sp. (strain B510) TaxID=137722 RepID=UPI0001C4C2A7|nr:hypothetical protein [Azospirillum sp. B510]BAI72531.1 hypothetical protein AZL_018930 [Azospirillum sp. B510]
MADRKPRHARPNATGRNETARFVMLPHYLLKSAAWMTMSPNAKALLIDIWRRHNGVNNGEIAYAVREATAIGLSKDQANRAFDVLIERGFLRVRRESSFNVKAREARLWELTAERCGDARATKEFITWTEPKEKSRSHRRDTQSRQRDCEATDEIKLPPTVSPARPSGAESAPPQSRERDTSKYHMGSLLGTPAPAPAAPVLPLQRSRKTPDERSPSAAVPTSARRKQA